MICEERIVPLLCGDFKVFEIINCRPRTKIVEAIYSMNNLK